MNLFSVFLKWLKDRLHVKPHELKNAPGIHDPAAAADTVNGIVSVAVDASAASGVTAVENALKLHPDTLKGAPGISDHAAAADAINALVKSKVEGQ